jgi:ribosomal protein L24
VSYCSKDIWTHDRVKVISGPYSGKFGVVTKRDPRFAKVVRYVWVRFDGVRGGANGPKIHVKNVQVTEMCIAHIKQKKTP